MTAQETMGGAQCGSTSIAEALTSIVVAGVTDESLNSLISVDTGYAGRDPIVGGESTFDGESLFEIVRRHRQNAGVVLSDPQNRVPHISLLRGGFSMFHNIPLPVA